MTFKKWKYNLLMIILIAIIGCYMGMTVFMSNDTALGVQQGGTEQLLPEEDEDAPELVVGDDDEEDEEEDEFIMPAGALDAVLSGINLLNNGEGYESTFSQTMTNTAMGMTVLQNTVGTIKKGVNSKGESVSVENFFLYSNETGVAASQVANYYRGIYVNYDTGAAQIAITPNYNYSTQTYDLSGATRNDQTSIDGVLSEFGIIQGQGFPLTLSRNSVTVTSDDNKSKVYRDVTLAYQVSALSQGYKQYWISNGQLNNLSYTGSTISITFRIQKKTGAITQIVRSESFKASMNYIGMNIEVSTNVRTVQKFTKVDSLVQIADSL